MQREVEIYYVEDVFTKEKYVVAFRFGDLCAFRENFFASENCQEESIKKLEFLDKKLFTYNTTLPKKEFFEQFIKKFFDYIKIFGEDKFLSSF